MAADDDDRADRMAKLMDELEAMPDQQTALDTIRDLGERGSREDAEAFLALARQRAAARQER